MADYDGFYTYKGHIVTIDLHEEEDCVKHWVEVTDPHGHTISPDVTPYGPSKALINKMIDAYIATSMYPARETVDSQRFLDNEDFDVIDRFIEDFKPKGK